MKKITFLLLTIILCSIKCYSSNNNPHVHGQANGAILISSTTVNITITIPSESVVGFEYSPKTNKEKETIENAKKMLKDTNSFKFFKKSKWIKNKQIIPLSSENKITTKFNENDHNNHSKHHKKHSDHHEHHTDHVDHDEHEKNHSNKITHSEFKIEYYYTFEDTLIINQITTDLFNKLVDLNKIEMTIITEESQKEINLNRKIVSFSVK